MFLKNVWIFIPRGRPRKAAAETCSSSSDANPAAKKPKKENPGKRGPKKRQKLRRFVDDDENVNDAFPVEENSDSSEEDRDEEMQKDEVKKKSQIVMFPVFSLIRVFHVWSNHFISFGKGMNNFDISDFYKFYSKVRSALDF